MKKEVVPLARKTGIFEKTYSTYALDFKVSLIQFQFKSQEPPRVLIPRLCMTKYSIIPERICKLCVSFALTEGHIVLPTKSGAPCKVYWLD